MHAAHSGRATDNVQPPRPHLLQQNDVWLMRRNQRSQVFDLRAARSKVRAEIHRHDPHRHNPNRCNGAPACARKPAARIRRPTRMSPLPGPVTKGRRGNVSLYRRLRTTTRRQLRTSGGAAAFQRHSAGDERPTTRRSVDSWVVDDGRCAESTAGRTKLVPTSSQQGSSMLLAGWLLP